MTFNPAGFPFNLDSAACAWIESSLEGMSEAQKLSQLFDILLRGNDPAEIAAVRKLGVGAVTRVGAVDVEEEQRIRDELNAAASVPLLFSADLEGSRMMPAGGLPVPNPLGLAAVADVAATARATEIMASDARELGINWSFTPLLDINAKFRSAIVATRSFGSDQDQVALHGLAQIESLQKKGVAATAKHWPGEGYDDRDQHLVTTVIPLSIREWEASFGALYRKAIDAGVLTVMSAHIAFPAYVRSLGHEQDAFRPAAINRHLNHTLLREELGFQGLIVSDASGMAGLGSFSPRREHLPELISAGCDMILFSNDVKADIGYLRLALDEGRLSRDRVDDALRRILALKAKLGLHSAPQADSMPRDREADQRFVNSLLERVPTLVKDTAGNLPLSAEKHRRVLIVTRGIILPFSPEPIPFALPELMRAKGFEVTLYRPGDAIDPDDFDLMLYLFGEETLLTRSNIYIDWAGLMGGFGGAMARYWHDVPTVMVSFGYPYYLYDAPRVPTYVNAYCTTEAMQVVTLSALLGEIEWQGTSPVDPFCGLEDARL